MTVPFDLFSWKHEIVSSLPGTVTSCAYDCRDKLYVVSALSFGKVKFTCLSLSTETIADLVSPPRDAIDKNNLVLSPTEKDTLYLLRGHNHSYRYSITNQKWTKITNNDNNNIKQKVEPYIRVKGSCVLSDKRRHSRRPVSNPINPTNDD
ncbi:hypothetical protein SAMD00019534_075800 [Acytostelium subglobosum LB1]|uniref:hypothetical protein n=1 Tax=Acytostelium subglobosum LB1 TaxID=1410327 RepID=UPI000644AE2C|nr:hypothetical protein SAMD00019534_075800 [Acytostelium subglobosum LB1]GAM24405.1 hypothetical protein SAMD00019534_075800 [Acytostelium subglobosum LB1]|eukprot:XP_012752731.1 hypothetical protein SAMD00019534_075800 [Acytostelium subglobosum LB1]